MTRREFLLAAPLLVRPWLPADRFADLLAESDKRDWKRLPIGILIAEIGKFLIGTPYVGATLDQDPHNEACVVRLDGLDCVTFFEVCLGFARMLKRGNRTYDGLVSEVTRTRYRDGKINGYLSRLHYTLDWMRDNVTKGVVDRVSLTGEVDLVKPLNFMSAHPNAYAALKANPSLLTQLRVIEVRLSADPLVHVPADKIALIESKLKTGDIVGIVTDVDGLDYSHTGLIVRSGKSARFMHASSTKKQVILDGRISEYVSGRKGALGASFVRPK